jgi:hypothetical protein
MALMDYELTFSDVQALSGASTQNSTNLVDRGAAGSLGAGTPIALIVKIGTITGTSPTLTINLVGADNAGFTTNKITVATLTPTIATGQADTLLHFGIPHTAAKRYYRLEYVVGGTTPALTVTAGMGLNENTGAMT